MITYVSNTKLSIFIYSFLVIGVVLVGLEHPVLQMAGEGSILLLLFLTLLLNIKNLPQMEGEQSGKLQSGRDKLQVLLSRDEIKIFLPLLVWIFLYFLSLLRSPGFHGVYVITQLILITSFLFLIYRRGNSLYPNRTFFYVAMAIMLANLVVVLLQSSGNFLYPFRPDGLFAHRNSLAIVSFYLLVLVLLYYNRQKSKVNYWLLIPFIYLIYVANSRSAYGALLVFLVTYYCWGFLNKNRVIYYTYLFSFVVVNLLFILLTIGFFDKMLPEASLIDIYFESYTGGNLQSGRHIIWPPIVDQITSNPLLGLGAGATPSDFLNTGWSAHNYYLQLLLQTGLLGFGAFLWFVTYAWSLFKKMWHDEIIRIIAAFFISILYHQTFEVSLTQNQMEQAVLFWFITGLGLNRIKYLQSAIKRKKVTVETLNL